MSSVVRPLLASLLSLLALTVHGAETSAVPLPPQTPASDADAPVAKVVPLLGFVLGQLGSMALKHMVGDPAGLFDKLRAEVGAGSSPAPGAPITPVVGYSIELLDPQTFAKTKALDVTAPPVLKTGDVFAVQYSTSLPGLVRLENIDPAGAVNDLGTYAVTPDQLNRMPSEKGIKLVGKPGTEVIRFYFYPCMPSGSESEPWAGAFKGRLPNCGRGPNPMVLAAANGSIRPKSLVNLAQPDASMSFSGSADYHENDVTSSVALIQHEVP